MTNKERESFVHMVFSLTHALEVLMKNAKIDFSGAHETKKYFNIFSNGIKQAQYGLSQLNDIIATDYVDVYGERGALMDDLLREEGNDIIRLLCHWRNASDNSLETQKFEDSIKALKTYDVFSEDTIEDYRLK